MAEINLGRVRGSDANVTKTNIEEALGYTPADTNLIGLLASLTTEQKTNLVSAINEIDGKVKAHEAENATDDVHGFKTYADTKVNKDGDSITGVYRINNIFTPTYTKVPNSNTNNLIKTKIPPHGTRFLIIKIKGKLSTSGGADTRVIDLAISCRIYNRALDFYASVKSLNSYKPEIKMGYDYSNGDFLVINIGDVLTKTNLYFEVISDSNDSGISRDMFVDWSITDEDISLYDNVNIIPYVE